MSSLLCQTVCPTNLPMFVVVVVVVAVLLLLSSFMSLQGLLNDVCSSDGSDGKLRFGGRRDQSSVHAIP